MPRLVTHGHNAAFCELLRAASDVRIASAYFAPDQATFGTLASASKLRLVVASNQWAVNDAVRLERLHSRPEAQVREIDQEPARLHAKVFLAKANEGTRRALVGSANLTRSAIGIEGHNLEVGVWLDDSELGDSSLLDEIEDWFDALWKQATEINFEDAKLAFLRTSALGHIQAVLHSLQPAANEGSPTDASPEDKFWAIKTREEGKLQRWPLFLADSIVGVFWQLDYGDDLNVLDKAEVVRLLRDKYDYTVDEAAPRAESIIRFLQVRPGHRVLVCNGYAWDRPDFVTIYGLSEITSAPYVVPHSPCPLRANARLLCVDRSVGRNDFVDALKKKSFMGAVHRLNRSEFEAVVRLVARGLE